MSEVTDKYLKEAVIPSNQREAKGLSPTMVNELLPEAHEIVVHRTFSTKDPVILDYYYKLAQKGKFGERIGHLIAQDAHGKIPKTQEVTNLNTEEKIDQIVVTVAQMTNLIQRTQRLTEASITKQTQAYKHMNNMSVTIQSQGILIETIRRILIDEGEHSKEEITEILDNMKTIFATKE